MLRRPSNRAIIKRAVKCGPEVNYRDVDPRKWLDIPAHKLTMGQKVCLFAYRYLKVPEGPQVGEPLLLDAFQVAFVLSVFDNPEHTRKAILSVARRNGKTFVVAVILLAAIVGPLAELNSTVASAAQSRDQAALCFRLMSLMLQQSPELDGLYKIIPSSKRIIGTRKNVEYMALAADAKTGHGKSLKIILLDEAGQIVEAENEYVSMLRSSQGSFEDARLFIISTQAPSDSSFLSLEIDASIRDQPSNVVTHVYCADEDADMMDQKQWFYANPGLGKYRSVSDLENQLIDARALPAKTPGVLNLLLNRRVAQEALAFSPEVWKDNIGPINLEVFRSGRHVSMGLDLSMVNDLTAAVLATKDDDGIIHLLTFAFTPLGGIEQRSKRDRVPYAEWARRGVIYAPPGDTLNYDLITAYMRDKLDELGIFIDSVYFDRYRMEIFRSACDRTGFCSGANFVSCGQGFVSMAPMIDGFETALLERRIRTDANPILNLGAASAIVEYDNVGNRRLTKKKAANKIDGIIAALMACRPHTEQTEVEMPEDLSYLIA